MEVLIGICGLGLVWVLKCFVALGGMAMPRVVWLAVLVVCHDMLWMRDTRVATVGDYRGVGGDPTAGMFDREPCSKSAVACSTRF